jgi:hypothetical protein
MWNNARLFSDAFIEDPIHVALWFLKEYQRTRECYPVLKKLIIDCFL